MSAYMICVLQQVLAASVKIHFLLYMETFVFYSVLYLIENYQNLKA